MQDAFLRFVRQPCPAHYLDVRRRVIGSANFRVDDDELQEAEDLFLADLPEEAVGCLLRAMPRLLLSPKVHWLLGRIAESSSMEDAREVAQMEFALGQLCIEGLLGTGGGDRDAPYLLTVCSDQQDILEYLEKRPLSEQRTTHQGRACLRVLCDDGDELMFDIHDLQTRCERSGTTATPAGSTGENRLAPDDLPSSKWNRTFDTH